ncbi:Asp/Glu/hydantoin racemase [Evansella caseinilytica]|uniref:Asp/Glu/hydantoin racemase n=1 Tax=Evansella caseinilytica TaxID=1503961 RepID=A0A1H3PE44_9BACI|nr:aspartate/glutamate racemase family protein [Evansella caseinilytica]SDY99318.1 Asp/Glu/hydantoin racemase [Evansella caseinilytica]
MLGIIRVLTTEDEAILQEHSRLIKAEFQLDSLTRCIPEQRNGIYNEETMKAAVPKIKALAKKMVKYDGVTAVAISCAADPAVTSCRELVNVPVIGAGEAGAYAALMVSRKVGVLGITREVPPNISSILGDAFLSYTYPDSVSTTVDLLKTGAMEKAVAAGRKLADIGATCILFACTGYSTIGLRNVLQKHVKLPVIDLVRAQAVAYSLTE